MACDVTADVVFAVASPIAARIDAGARRRRRQRSSKAISRRQPVAILSQEVGKNLVIHSSGGY